MTILEARKTRPWATAASISRERRDDLIEVRVTLLESSSPAHGGPAGAWRGRRGVHRPRLGDDLATAFGQKTSSFLHERGRRERLERGGRVSPPALLQSLWPSSAERRNASTARTRLFSVSPGQPELDEDTRDVSLDGPGAQEELLRDPEVGPPLGHVPEHRAARARSACRSCSASGSSPAGAGRWPGR